MPGIYSEPRLDGAELCDNTRRAQEAGMFDPTTYTGFHTWLSLVALGSGIIVAVGMLRAQTLPLLTALFLVTAVATSVTGFGFPFTAVLPSHVIAAISLLVLAGVLLARYAFHLAGAWRWIYAVGAVIALYFLAFVAIFQAFLKVPALRAAAPTQSEPPFAVTQLVLLVVCLALAIVAARTFRPGTITHR